MEILRSLLSLFSGPPQMRPAGGEDPLALQLRQAWLSISPGVYRRGALRLSLAMALAGGALGLLVGGPPGLLGGGLGCAGGVYWGLRAYPRMRARVRALKLDVELPHAVAFMEAMAQGGAALTVLLRSLRDQRGLFPETSRLAGAALTDMELLGQSPLEALRRLRDRTASEKFRSFVDGLASTLESGSRLADYLRARGEAYHQGAVSDARVRLESLSLVAEAYVTGFVAGPLFLIVMLLMLGFIGQTLLGAFAALIYLVIPLGTLGFLVALETIMPPEMADPRVELEEAPLRRFPTPRAEAAGEERRLLERLEKRRRWMRLLSHPVEWLIERPRRVLAFSLPLGLVLFLGEWLSRPRVFYNPFTIPVQPPVWALKLDDAILLGLVTAMAPYAFFYEWQRRRARRLEKEFPDFLGRLASVHTVGLTLTEAIRVVVRSPLGLLGKEVRRAYGQIQWGTLTGDALIRLQRRLKTLSSARVITLLVHASRHSSHIGDVLSTAARDSATAESLRRDTRNSVFPYVTIVYICFGVFLFITYILTSVFLPVVPVPGLQGQAGLVGPLVARGTGKEMFKLLFFHAALIQGFFTGLVAGKMGEGSTSLGLKHGLAMTLIAYIAFQGLP
ncbi:MAG: type II secretion system F family protein [Euryarchaeota archaeon]|nr:type II secretion system F family protein [Euryarchaeota archaeon]